VSYDEFKEAVSREPILQAAIFHPMRRFLSGRGFPVTPSSSAASGGAGGGGGFVAAAADKPAV